MPIQAPLLLPSRTSNPSTQSSRDFTANATTSPRESQRWVYFFARKRNEFLQRRFSDFREEKAQIFLQWEKCLPFCEYIYSLAPWFPSSPVSIQSMPFLWMLSHSLSSHHLLLLRSYHITPYIQTQSVVIFNIHSRKPTSIIYFNFICSFLLSHSRCGSPSSFIAWLFPLLPSR